MRNEDKKVMDIRVTKDYDKFKFIGPNRVVISSHVSKLIKSMKEQYLMCPIMVNSDFEIIDGQHRFTSARDLELPVYYYMVEGYGIEEVQRSNSNSIVWNDNDRLHSYISSGNEEYMVIKGIMDKYEVKLEPVITLFARVQKISLNSIKYKFRNGLFVSLRVNEVEKFFDDLECFSFFNEYKKKSFISAFIDIYFNPDYDHELMAKKVPSKTQYFEKMSSKHKYIEFLCNHVYSFGASSKNIYYNESKRRFHK